jgi:electron transport complex protein RnfD
MSAPHLRVGMSSVRMTWLAALSLAPALGYGLAMFGPRALLVAGVAIGAALASELAVTLPRGRFSLADGSAFFTGLLVGLFLPAGASLYVPAAASAFGILVIKQSFGGLGRNWMNPAMGGVLFAMISWPGPVSRWVPPLGMSYQDAVVPPLDALRGALSAAGAHDPTPLAVLAKAGYAFSGIDSRVLGWINAHLLAPLGAALPPGTFDVLAGHVAGAIGSSVPFVMLGASFLLTRRVVRWHLPVLYLATFAILSFLFGGLGTGQGWLAGGPGFQLLSGTVVLAAFYAAPDPVTSPLTNAGKCVLGISLGVLTFFLRFFGSLGDGTAAAIVLGNCLSPLLDQWTSRRGTLPARREAA